ncbi:MAG: HlyD family efflux transporter periplasmic adaptor subunit [Lutibacter sp.]|uniref:efflux RND transporter periplasmic adaptor subunit n=1 Tax=Lutibacter sp. TaxID=1925666 RepID=UPI0017C0F1B2|nr:HlyD family efflux transporter periplasmic adaptor subunit [Lutibacter sp.]MBT8316016.1 HlyD family efflux transporter periplasmic adaptor subunit [Lutibacter sp.]NNJ56876.1 HlyD family efflux transporter periplasmic adaptor subunit [Lutibacter sp.]
MRKIILIVLSVILIAGSIFFAKYLIDSKNKPKQKLEKIVKTVFTEVVTNNTVPLVISTNGNLVAKNKIELYAEVQGVLQKTSKDFKQGTSYSKGETIIKINSDEFYANLQAQKSNLFNLITAIMPDIRLDYPSEFDKWQNYLQNFDNNGGTNKLPEFASEKEKFFISGRGINTAYYNVKNLEVKLNKHNIRAPFNGILTESLVNPGTLIRVGQKLGEFISPSVYEIGVSIKSEFKDLLQVGKQVKLHNLEKTKTWTGKVIRINGKLDTATQTIKAFIEVVGKDLKEGQYLEIELQAKAEENAYEVQRNLIVENSKLYIVKDSVLDLISVNPIFENENTVIVKGLPNGTVLLSKPVPGSYAGMLVTIFNENKK